MIYDYRLWAVITKSLLNVVVSSAAYDVTRHYGITARKSLGNTSDKGTRNKWYVKQMKTFSLAKPLSIKGQTNEVGKYGGWSENNAT